LAEAGLELARRIKIAAWYLILAGGMGILWPLTGLGPYHPEFEASSFASKLGSYTRIYLVDILFVTSGIGLLYGKIWARKLALVILVVGAVYTANEAAWGFAGGHPTPVVRFVWLMVVGVWNGVWFYLIFKKKRIKTQETTG
jgi:hypothetical protein